MSMYDLTSTLLASSTSPMSDTVPVMLLGTGFSLVAMATGDGSFDTEIHGQITAALRFSYRRDKS